jgi:hypothetical protein
MVQPANSIDGANLREMDDNRLHEVIQVRRERVRSLLDEKERLKSELRSTVKAYFVAQEDLHRAERELFSR